MNKIFLIGNLTRDPEGATTPNNVTYCRFGIAVNRDFKNADGTRGVDFFNITAWRGLADTIMQYCHKGNKVSVVGRMEMRTYDDNNGNKRTDYSVVAEDVEFLTPKASGENAEYTPVEPAQRSRISVVPPVDRKTRPDVQPKLEELSDDDIPF